VIAGIMVFRIVAQPGNFLRVAGGAVEQEKQRDADRH
jgi:hypothetical protein